MAFYFPCIITRERKCLNLCRRLPFYCCVFAFSFFYFCLFYFLFYGVCLWRLPLCGLASAWVWVGVCLGGGWRFCFLGLKVIKIGKFQFFYKFLGIKLDPNTNTWNIHTKQTRVMASGEKKKYKKWEI